jgi:MinD-like ATPase involved in chromosome partitioning or flagellar assembly
MGRVSEVPVLAIVGTKGGVSKSTLSMGLATWISKLRPKDWCLLIDGDMHVRSVELKMCRVHDATLKDVLTRGKPWETAVYSCELEDDDGELLYPNLAVLPAGGRFMPPMRESPLTYLEMAKRVFGNMIEGLRKKFEYIIIDTPASVGFEHFILTASADAVIYVCEPNEDSINSTFETSEELKNLMNVEALGVVLSRVPDSIYIKPWFEKLKQIAPLLGSVPEDPKVGVAFRKNLPVVAAYPESPASVAMEKIARKVLGATVKRTEVDEKLERGFEKVLKQVKEIT